MKKIIRKTLKITGVTLIVLIAAAFLIPILFKKQIVALVKKEINSSLAAKVDFADVSLSLFRHFPKISIGLQDVSVVGTHDFEKDTLLSARSFEASVNLFSAIKGKDIKVYGVYLESPRIHAIVNKNGKANWDITQPGTDTSSSASSPSAFKMSLQKYKISEGYIEYRDESSNMSAAISGLDHEGSGDFTSDVFTLVTRTKARAVSFNYESVPYLVNTQTAIDADIQVDNSQNKYSFRTDDIRLNNLRLNADGFFQVASDSSYNMGINFQTPSNDFKDILSMIPAIYKQDFDKIRTSGQASLHGFVKGTYSPAQLPAYDLKLAIKDGTFQYPDLPDPVSNIQVDLEASNVDGKPDNAIVNISRGHIEMGKEPFDFKLLFKNPETVQYIDALAKGKIDLANITRFVKLEPGTKLGGTIAADAFAKGNMASLQNQEGNFSAGGFLDINDLYYASSALPQAIQHGNMKVQLDNQGGIADNTTIAIPSGHIELGKDPVDFTLQLRKPMSVAEFSGTAKGSLALDMIRQFVQLEPGTQMSGTAKADLAFSGSKAALDKGEYDKILVNGMGGLSNLKYSSKDYPTGITVSIAEAMFSQKTMTLKNLAGNYLKTNFTANGTLNNLVGFAMQDQPLSGNLNLSADKMNLNDWMGTMPVDSGSASKTTAATTSPQPFLVPANINLTLNAKLDQVKYDKVDYNNVAGTLLISDETVKLQNVKTNALDGTVTFNGSYSTRGNKKEPAISINYDVKDVDVQKAFFAFNTVQKLMPIGQFIAGKLQSQLSMNGNLHGDMMPDLGTLTGKGNLLLVEGLLKKFAPLEKLANTLQIDELKSITIKDIKNYIEFANGKVLVKPFTVKVKDIEMQIGGMHGFDQTLDYAIQMKVPRKYLGNEGNSLLNNLASQAAGKGIPVKLGDVVNLNIKMGGKMTDPTIRTELKEVAGDAIKDMQQQAVEFAKAKADTIKQAVRDTIATVKNQVFNDLKEEAKNRILGSKDSTGAHSLDSTKKKTGETLKNTINSLFNRKKNQKPDTTGKQ
jgi:hypothetical protein